MGRLVFNSPHYYFNPNFMYKLTDEKAKSLLNEPSYKFMPVKYDLVNDWDSAIVKALEANPVLNDRAYWWNKQGGVLTFKILVPVTPKQKNQIIKAIETTHKCKLWKVENI